MMASPQPEKPTFAMISNGQSFLFLKLTQQPQPRYANSRLFSLINPGNDLYDVVSVMRRIGQVTIAAS